MRTIQGYQVFSKTIRVLLRTWMRPFDTETFFMTPKSKVVAPKATNIKYQTYYSSISYYWNWS